ncbi:MAG: divalent-cation tolerance protein CutA [Pyrinomonadaceae bacterium]|jgi:periplasmic divalent cation tolerance protein|nr:divalent-cation tolerance protein CutA [Acidobacteriota bacterium]
MIVILTTSPTIEEAEVLARKIIEAKLAACVQVVPQVTSFYFWETEVIKDSEQLLLIKTLPEKFDRLKDFIQKNHSYDVPEIVALSAEKVSENYLNWIKDSIEKM